MELLISLAKEEANRSNYNQLFEEIKEKAEEKDKAYAQNEIMTDIEKKAVLNEKARISQYESEKKLIDLFDQEKIMALVEKMDTFESLEAFSEEISTFLESANEKEQVIFSLLLVSIYEKLEPKKVIDFNHSLVTNDINNKILGGSSEAYFETLMKKSHELYAKKDA